jgi:Flp pilus assembly pilin Flp
MNHHRARVVTAAIVRDESGQGLAEYALIVTLVGAVAIGALTLVGADISSMISTLADQL